MAIRSLNSKLPSSLSSYCRRLQSSSAAASIFSGRRLTFTGIPGPRPDPKPENPKPNGPEEPFTINLEDSKKLFSSVPTSKLITSAFYLHLASNEFVIDMGLQVMTSGLMKGPVSRKVVLESIQRTIYNHFCGGRDLKEADETARKLRDSGLSAMLDYGLEHADDSDSCDKNLEQILETIDSTLTFPSTPISFVVVKITAICPVSLLKRVSDLLRWEYKTKSIKLPWKMQSFPIFSDLSALYHTLTEPEPLTAEEEASLELGYQRLIKICEKSLQANIPLLIDAEETSIQPAIDHLAYSAAIKYHRGDQPLIFNTIQAYLKDAEQRLVIAKKAADGMAVPVGFKIVRGAYIRIERRIADSLGAISPIHETINDTHDCYNKCTSFMLEQIANGSGSLVLATHNLESGKLAASQAVNLGIKKENHNLQFAQLYGMAESLSFSLKNAGFRVSKYLPYGPVEQIMPYLLRRAEENKGLFSNSSIDRQLIRKELLRRLRPFDM